MNGKGGAPGGERRDLRGSTGTFVARLRGSTLLTAVLLLAAFASLPYVPSSSASSSSTSSSSFSTSASSSPQVGDFFEYQLTRKVGDGGGEYSGYSDTLTSSGRYEITSVAGGKVSFTASYTWSYRDSEGRFESGSEDRNVVFDLATRRYQTKTDLDELDKVTFRGLSIWFWAEPSTPKGAAIQVLDENYTVTSRDSGVWTNWAPRLGLRAEGSGVSSRLDSYGSFTFDWHDTYHYDQTTGYVIAIRYEEHDRGTYQGLYATFKLTEEFDLKASSFAMALDYVSLGGAIGWIAGPIFLLFLAARAYRWRARTFIAPGIGSVKMRRVRRMSGFPRGMNEASPNFGAFLEDFGRKAFLAGDHVAVAVSPGDGKVHGVAIHNREAKIGTILCKDSFVTERLRRFLKFKDFFTESRHLIPASVVNEAATHGATLPTGYVYNVYETYQVLMLNPIPKLDHDRSLVTLMTKDDLPRVAEIARKVHGVKATRWLRAQMASGDVGFVARVGGTPVGFAFASYANGHGRVHTATVLPEHQGKGIGKELMRARLGALEALGADYALTEIADWNLASLHVATSLGFRKIAAMVVETSRTTKVKRAIVRR